MTSVLRRAVLLVGLLATVVAPLFMFVPSAEAAPTCPTDAVYKGFTYDLTNDRCTKTVGPAQPCPGQSIASLAPEDNENGVKTCVIPAVPDIRGDPLPVGKVCPLNPAYFNMVYDAGYGQCTIAQYPGGGCPDGTFIIELTQICGAPPINNPNAGADLPKGKQCLNPKAVYDKNVKACKSDPAADGTCSKKYKEQKNGEYCLATPRDIPAGAQTANTSDGCPVESGTDLRGMICGFYWMMSKTTQALDSFINQYMTVGNKIFETVGEEGNPYHNAWEVFRNFAIGLVVIAGLVMLVSEAFGIPIVDAYTVRKVLPRLLVAVIGIAVSWELCKFLIELFDDLGHGVGSTIYTAFNAGNAEGQIQVDIWKVIVGQLIVGGAVAWGALLLQGPGLLSLLGTLIVAMLIAAAVLVIRQAIIIACVLGAPLAIAAYVLPNTNKLANFWWSTLWRMLMLYPIATGLIALCKVLGSITMTNPGGDGNNFIGDLIALITGMFLFFAGYALMPLAFRLTGGLVATIGGMANSKSRGFFDKQKKNRAEQMDRSKQEMASGNRWKGDSKLAGFANATTQNIAGVRHAGFNPRRMRSRMQAELSKDSMLEAAEYGEKDTDFGVIKGNDDFLNAAIKGGGDEKKTRQLLDDMGYQGATGDQAMAAIRAARRATSAETFHMAAVMALPATGTAFKTKKDKQGNIIGGGAGEMHRMILDAAGGDHVKAANMLAQMRSGAAGARRFDLAGGSYGQQLATMEGQRGLTGAAAQSAEVAATKKIIDDSLKGQGGGYITNARKDAVESFAPAMYDRLKGFADAGDVVSFKRELAAVANRYDAMSGAAPDNAKIIAEQVMARELSPGKSVRQYIEENRNDEHFRSVRKEFGSDRGSGGADDERGAGTGAGGAS